MRAAIVPPAAVRRSPHFLEAELLHPRLVGGDGRAFHPDAEFLGGVGGIHGDLVVGGVAVLDGEIVDAQVKIEIGVDQLLFDEIPDDPRHLIAFEIGDRVLDLDLVHLEKLSRFERSVGSGQAGRRPL